jgi:ATP phosphoribosyltransferase regulatory subunit HisZ
MPATWREVFRDDAPEHEVMAIIDAVELANREGASRASVIIGCARILARLIDDAPDPKDMWRAVHTVIDELGTQ